MTSTSQTDRLAVDTSDSSDARSDVQAVSDDAETPEELLALWEEEAPEPAGGIANLVACALTLAFGIAGMVLSLNLSLGSLTDPAPGFFPFVISLITTVLSAAQMVLGRRGGDGEKFSRY